MINLLDNNSKNSTALEHVVDPASVANMVTKEAEILTIFVLKRHSPTSLLKILGSNWNEKDTWNRLVWTVTGNIFKAGTGSRIKFNKRTREIQKLIWKINKPQTFFPKNRRCRPGLKLYPRKTNCASLHGRYWLRRKVGYEKYLNIKSSSNPRDLNPKRST